MAASPNVAVSLARVKCHEQEDSEPPIFDTEDDEPYIVVLRLDVGDRKLSGLLGSASPPPFEISHIGPINMDKGDSKPAPVNQLWNLDGHPAPMPNPERTLFMVSLLENDNGSPAQVANQTRTLLQGTLLASWNNANNRQDLDEPRRFDFYVDTARAAFESAIDTARGFSPPGAVLDPDDKIGSPQVLRFTADEHQQVANHVSSKIERILRFEGDDAKYDLTFELLNLDRWRAFALAPAGSAALNSGIAAVSRVPNSMELWWIGPDGTVRDAYWYDGMTSFTRYTLAPAGSAALNSGIAAVSRVPNSMELWWIGADGTIHDAYWYE